MIAMRCSDCDRLVPLTGLQSGMSAGKADGTKFLCFDCLDRTGELKRMEALGERYYVPLA